MKKKGLSAEPEVLLPVNPDIPRSEERQLPCWQGRILAVAEDMGTSGASAPDCIRLLKLESCHFILPWWWPLAIFQLGPVNEDTAGSYQCLYSKGSMWSQRSETLELKVTSEDVTHTSDPVSGVTSGSTLQSCKVWNGIRIALAGVVFLVLGAIIGEAWYNQQKYMDSSRTPGGYNQGD
ncbi:leukocyte immunoglobulin-like receptor subfamily A member 5 isoform X5 [Microtus pennsylvanicus]|uniref:leukocyte immunoglobulin-like receptor subfamily A member 5 isoform X5 n=1 Tax=Microtus pennsylvanicus TaxID=10058 RepID=UPI003F6CB78C